MKKKHIVILILIAAIIPTMLIGVIPSITDFRAKQRVYSDMEARLPDVMNSNIRIVSVEKNRNNTAYGKVGNGVIIRKDGNTYHALTACHIFNHDGFDHFLVVTQEDGSVSDYKKEHEGAGQEDYYNMLPKVKVELRNEESDIAIISFASGKELSAVSVSETMPEKGDRIALVFNLEGEKFLRTYGNVISNAPEKYSFHDSQADNLVMKHSAYEAPGSSGCAVYNENLELVGINIGGELDMFGRFRCGIMIPVDQIRDFIANLPELH